MKRREFFTKGFPAYFFKMGEAFAEVSGIKKNPHDMMFQAAEQLGIEIGGKDKLTLAREIYAVKGMKGFE